MTGTILWRLFLGLVICCVACGATGEERTYSYPVCVFEDRIEQGIGVYMATSLQWSFSEADTSTSVDRIWGDTSIPENYAANVAYALQEKDFALFEPLCNCGDDARRRFNGYQFGWVSMARQEGLDLCVSKVASLGPQIIASIDCCVAPCATPLGITVILLSQSAESYRMATSRILESGLVQAYFDLYIAQSDWYIARSKVPVHFGEITPTSAFTVAVPELSNGADEFKLHFNGVKPDWAAHVYHEGEYVDVAYDSVALARPYYGVLRFFRDTMVTMRAIRPGEGYMSSPEVAAFLSRIHKGERKIVEMDLAVGPEAVLGKFAFHTIDLKIAFLIDADPLFILLCEGPMDGVLVPYLVLKEGELFQLLDFISRNSLQDLLLEESVNRALRDWVLRLP